jgi:hypothetical protein
VLCSSARRSGSAGVRAEGVPLAYFTAYLPSLFWTSAIVRSGLVHCSGCATAAARVDAIQYITSPNFAATARLSSLPRRGEAFGPWQ